MTTATNHDADSELEQLKDRIAYLSGVHEPAAPRHTVKKYIRRELGRDDADAYLDRLERDGEIYCPRPGFLKVTDA